MRNSKYLFLSLIVAASAIGHSALAGQEGKGPGPTDSIACKGKKGSRLEVAPSAIPTFGTATLDLGKTGKFDLNCTRQFSDARGGDQEETLWSCEERRAGEGTYHVEIRSGGITGKTFAYVSIGQVFPLNDKPVITLVCN